MSPVLLSRDLAPLQEILRATEAAERHLAGQDEAAFLADELRQSAVAQQLFVLRCAALRLSSAARSGLDAIPWRALVEVGDLMIEPGASIDWQLVWRTATRDLPEMRCRVRALLDQGA
jgi:uncharacterized protein with HEPN domain